MRNVLQSAAIGLGTFVVTIGTAYGAAYAQHAMAPHHAAACAAPHMPGQTHGTISSGTRITGTDGRNGIAPGDVYACQDGHVTIS